FQLDNQGYVTNNQGMRLQGYAVDATGAASGVTGDIQLPTQGIAPQVTGEAKLSLNLDARTAAPDAGKPFSIADASSYTSSTSLSVYDQQGNEHVLSTYFRRADADNTWDVYTALDGTGVPAAAAGATQEPSGQLAFAADGTLDLTKSGSLAGGTLTAGDL